MRSFGPFLIIELGEAGVAFDRRNGDRDVEEGEEYRPFRIVFLPFLSVFYGARARS